MFNIRTIRRFLVLNAKIKIWETNFEVASVKNYVISRLLGHGESKVFESRILKGRRIVGEVKLEPNVHD